MNSRLRRISADWKQVKKDFENHPNIVIEPLGPEPPERYKITYYVKGVYALDDGRIAFLEKHIVEIYLHAEYPRYKPICKILTPIWHPNFRDDQICIGDIWGAGESLSHIIVNIGDMIQYKSWNAFSPLSADAAKWAIENKEHFPVGNINLWDSEESKKRIEREFEIDYFEDDEKQEDFNDVFNTEENIKEKEEESIDKNNDDMFSNIEDKEIEKENDFDLTPEDLKGIDFTPSVERMHSSQYGNINISKGRITFATILKKGIIYGLLGGIIGWFMQEYIVNIDLETVLNLMGYESHLDFEEMPYAEVSKIYEMAIIITTIFFSTTVGSIIGAMMGLGEGIYYGSKSKAMKYMLIGFGISLVISGVCGAVAQVIFSKMLENTMAFSFSSITLARAVGWSMVGLGVGIPTGLIKPQFQRILYCSIGGLVGGFAGGIFFQIAYLILPIGDGIFSRAVGIVFLGALIGLGVGLLEQFAKSAWLKVIRGEFEGKEYLVFSGKTTIGSTGKNTIVLFKDKLIAPNHCEIVLEGNRYVLVDKNSPKGTFVNGSKIKTYYLKKGDTIALGNTVLEFNMK